MPQLPFVVTQLLLGSFLKYKPPPPVLRFPIELPIPLRPTITAAPTPGWGYYPTTVHPRSNTSRTHFGRSPSAPIARSAQPNPPFFFDYQYPH